MEEKKFKLAYFFFIGSERLSLTDINKQTKKKHLDKFISFFKKPNKKKIYSGTIKDHFLMPSLFHVQRSALRSDH